MKKILFITDTHGNIRDIKRLETVMREVDYIFFAGDNYKDLDGFMDNYGEKIYRVKGNCDFFSDEPEELEIKVENVSFLLCHGHRYNVKFGLLRLRLYAEQTGFNAVCFGHTHKALIEDAGALTLINAGNLTGRGKKTYALIEVENGRINAEIKELI